MTDATNPQTSETPMTGSRTNPVEASGAAASQAMFDFNDARFLGALRRTMWNIAVLGVVLAGLLTMFYGWRTGLMLLIGAGISLTGVWEWRRLIAAINVRLDAQRNPLSLVRTLFTFVVRLAMVGAVLYGSLRYLEGSLYALVAGLSLAMIMLTVEAFRLLKQ
ncbi:MAG: ATP synthase subunit I [Acidobacteriaceae bacterium]